MTNRKYQVAVIRGGPEDDSGPELMEAALHVIKSLLADAGIKDLEFIEVESGKHLVGIHGSALPEKSLETILNLGLVYKAPTTGSKSSQTRGISLTLREKLKTYANIVPCKSYKGVKSALRPNIDMVMVRENSEGLINAPYFYPQPEICCDIRVISEAASRRIARIALEMAQARKKKLTICGFPNGVQGDRHFITVCQSEAEHFPEIEVDVRKPDSLSGMLIAQPDYFDVVVAPNEWGSIITDAMVATTGSVGLGPRINQGDSTALFEPMHGSAPGKAGKGTVNPIGQILAGKLMLEWLGSRHNDSQLSQLANRLETAVTEVLDSGKVLPGDLGGKATTRQVADAIIEQARKSGGV